MFILSQLFILVFNYILNWRINSFNHFLIFKIGPIVEKLTNDSMRLGAFERVAIILWMKEIFITYKGCFDCPLLLMFLEPNT